MITRADLTRTARAHLSDARLLAGRSCYDGAAYLCGYAIEIALKARICRTLRWEGFPSTAKEFEFVKSVQTHNFEALLRFSGVEGRIKPVLAADWTVATRWSPEQRYHPVGTKTATDAAEMIAATKILLAVLL